MIQTLINKGEETIPLSYKPLVVKVKFALDTRMYIMITSFP